MSLSARRAWIEIINNNYNDLTRPVALRKESVDRNCYLDNIEITQAVALRKESVDRNLGFLQNFAGHAAVALRKESVDRNTWVCRLAALVFSSLSARRAWIEILGENGP